MPSSSLTPKKDATTTVTYLLNGSSPLAAEWIQSGYGMAVPRKIEQSLKRGPVGATANDHVLVKISQSDINSDTGKVATAQVTLDISIPRDTETVTLTEIQEMLGILASLLNDNAAVENPADGANRIALSEGRFLNNAA